MARAVTAWLLLFIAAPAPAREQDDPQSRVLSLLTMYDAGRYGEIESLLATPLKAPLADELRRHGDKWIATGPAELRDRRRVVAGAVALEIVAAGLRDEWKDVVPVVEWACKHVIATAPGSTAEQAWHIAAIAVLQDGAGMMRTVAFVGEHLEKHSLKRLPDSPRVQLALAVDQEREVYRPTRSVVRPEVTPEAMARFRMQSAKVVERYTTLAGSESVGEEARLRLGAFYLRIGAIDEALPHLSPLSRSNDAFIGYVSSFLAGEAHRAQGRTQDAIDAYRRALIHVPNAMSASIGLSLSLASTDDMTGALAAMNGAALSSAPIDPWRLFAYGEGRHWTQRRDTLRKELSK